MRKEELKDALLNRDFERAQALISAWREAISASMKAASDSAERYRILEDAQSFLEQHLYLARVVRTHIATELKANSASFLYRNTELEQPRWRVRG
jgi:arginine repressor